MDKDTRNVLIVAFLAIIVAILIVIFFPKGNKPLCVSEGFQNIVLDCPTNTKSYIDDKGNTNCCKGKLNGNKCEGPVACTLSAGGVSKDVIHCMYYSHEGTFNPQNQQIRSTGNSENLCFTYNNKGELFASKCNDSPEQKFTYTKDKQLTIKGGHFLRGTDFSQFGQPIIVYTFLYDSKSVKDRTFNYRMDKTLNCEAFPNTSVSILQDKKTKQGLIASIVNPKDAMKKYREATKNVTYNIDYSAVEKKMNEIIKMIQKDFNIYNTFDVLPNSTKKIEMPAAIKKYFQK